MCPPLILCYVILGLVYLYMVFHRWKFPSYKVLLSCKLDFWSPAKTCIRVMINCPAYKAFAWTVFCFRSLFSLELYVKTSYLIRSNALYPLFISWCWNCTTFCHVQTSSWLVCNLKTGAYWAGGSMYVIACLNATINQNNRTHATNQTLIIQLVHSHFIDWPLHIHRYKTVWNRIDGLATSKDEEILKCSEQWRFIMCSGLPLIGSYHCFEGMHFLHLQGETWVQFVSPNWWPPTGLQGSMIQKTKIKAYKMYLKANNTTGNRTIKNEVKRVEVSCQIKCRMIQNRQSYTGVLKKKKKARMAILEVCTVKNDSFHGK